MVVLSWLLIGAVLVSGQEPDCPASICPDGWVTFRGSCYYVSDNMSLSWTESVHHCSLHHAHLVTIETKEENAFLRDQLERMYRTPQQRPGQEFWIGANDEMIEGVWQWYVEDTPLSYNNWYPGQPASDGGKDEDCAVIAARDGVYNGWHDAPCDRLHHPICELSGIDDGPVIVG